MLKRTIVALCLCAASLPLVAQNLADEPTAVLAARLRIITSEISTTQSVERVHILLAEEDRIDAVLFARDAAAIHGNSDRLAAGNMAVYFANQALVAVDTKKRCHQNLWRLLRGYREPDWCSNG